MAEERNYAEILCKAFDMQIQKDYGAILPPPPNITPTKVRTLDALLGGGVVSSHPICLSSSPETGAN